MTRVKAASKKNIEDFSKAIGVAAKKDHESFLTWFDNNENITEVISSGYRHFFSCVLKDDAYDLTGEKASELTALEIGCGGGRIMNAAAKYFKYVIGLDIHDNLEETDGFLSQLGNTNFETRKIRDGVFPVADESIDFVYSMIVFQHLLKIETLDIYLKETARILKKGGLAVIYFGRPRLVSKIPTANRLLSTLLTFFDKLLFECLYLNVFKKGVIEYPNVPTNYINLVLSTAKISKLFRENNLNVIAKGTAKKNNLYGRQYFFIVQK